MRVKNRINNILSFKKATIWVIIAVAVVAIVGLGLLLNHKAKQTTEGSDIPTDEATQYLSSLELYNGEGEIIKAVASPSAQTATQLASLLLEGTDKTKESINDFPQNVKECLRLDIGADSEKVYFVYEQNNKYWVEKPYDYKRELEEKTYNQIMDIFTACIPASPKLTKEGASEALKYTLQDGNNFTIKLKLQNGLTLSLADESYDENYPEYFSQASVEMPVAVVAKDGNPIGFITVHGLGGG